MGNVFFQIMGHHMARGVGNIDVGAMLQVVINFHRIRQGTPHCLTLSSYTIAKMHTKGEVWYLRLPYGIVNSRTAPFD